MMKCRGNLKQVGIYLFLLVNGLLVKIFGIPVGTLGGLASDGRCFFSFAPQKMSQYRIYRAKRHAVDVAPARAMSPLAGIFTVAIRVSTSEI